MNGGVPRPSKWVSSSGKVHRRRLRFWPGTEFERFTKMFEVTTLCGLSALKQNPLWPAPKGAKVDCDTCLKAERTRAHLRGVFRL